jgi:putative NADH-flavin reductase
MNVLVLGATGRTGRELLAQGVERGHVMTALVRDPDKLAVEHEPLRVVTGGATDAAALDEALKDQDAVICALGPTSPAALVSCDLMRATTRAIVPVMKRRGVDRLVMLSALGVGASAPYAPALLRIAFRTLLGTVGRDKAAAEEHLRASDVDWTLVYPPSLTNGPRTGTYRAVEALDLGGLPKISRADVADFMLAQLEEPEFSRKAAIVGP